MRVRIKREVIDEMDGWDVGDAGKSLGEILQLMSFLNALPKFLMELCFVIRLKRILLKGF